MKKSIVLALHIKGDEFILTGSRDGGAPAVEDEGTLVVHRHTLDMTYYGDTQPEYTMRFWVSGGELRLRLLHAWCAKTDPSACATSLVSGTYGTFPFKLVD